MNITDITLDHRIKACKTSITVKDHEGKTKGIITDCRTFHNMFTRDQFDLHNKLKKFGVNNLDIASNCVIKDNNIYYLYNVSLRKHIERYGAFDEREQIKLDKLEETATRLKENNIPVIECLFIA
jgi:hypothetical protein